MAKLLCSIGDAAKAAFHTAPSQTVFDAKRLIGRKFDDPDIKRDMKHWPFKVVNKGGKPMIQVQNKNELKDFVRAFFDSLSSLTNARYRPPRKFPPWS
jgi:molecular chaperone DnaK (HSP70)